MGRLVFLYPGEGSQMVGMGGALLREVPGLFEKYLSRSEQVAGAPVARYCLEGPLDLLSQANIAQPALFACSLALTEYAQRCGLRPDFVAGHSLGEYTAAVAAEALPFDKGVYLVCERGKLMYQIQKQCPGAMAAVIGLPEEDLYKMCSEISRSDLVVVTNRNAPAQFVVSGVATGVARLMEESLKREHVRVVRLPVKGGFHSPLMTPVQSVLKGVIWELPWKHPSIPLVSNISGSLLTDGQQIEQELIDQITSPVLWVSCIQTLVEAGCDTFVELGPGQVLTKLVRVLVPGARAVALDTPAKILAFAEAQEEVLQAA